MIDRLFWRLSRFHFWRAALWVAAGLACGVLIAVLAPLELLLLCLLVGVAVGSFFEPLVGVIAGLFFGPLRAWLAIYAPGIPDQLGQGLFMLGVAGWIARGLARRELRLTLGPLALPLWLFLGAGLLSLWSPFDLWAGFTEWAKWLQVALTLWMVGERLRGAKAQLRVMALIIALGAIGVGQGLLGIWQHRLAGEAPSHFLIAPGIYRAYGTFMQPNPFGGFLGLLGALLTGLLLVSLWEVILARAPAPRWLWLLGGAVLVIAGGLYGSWSRGAWLGFGAALAAMAALLPRRSVWGMALVVVFAGAVLLLMATDALPASVEARLTDFAAYLRFENVRGVGINDANYAVIERMAHWQAALGMWETHFWTGVGIGNYEAAYPLFRLVNWPYALGHAHNFYLNLLAETGLIGLGAYLLLFAAIFVRLWQATRSLSGWQRGLALGLVGAWTQISVHSMVDNLYVNNVHLHVGVLLALTAWLVGVQRVTVCGDVGLSGG
ncbi:MAG: O-antigen ligase family protein [Anaerolineae bacterium]|nr:O-antigen ligase family protein [Anaerolineae bacterium]